MKNFIYLNCLLTVFFLFGCEPEEKHELYLNLEVGNTYILEQETSQIFKQELMGMDIDMRHQFNVVYSLYVDDFDNDSYYLDFEYKDITMNVEGSGVDMIVSSKDMQGTDDTLSMIFKAFTGKHFKTGITQSGEVSFVEGIEDFFDSVSSELDFVVDCEEREAIEAFDQFIGKGGFKDNISQLTNYLPAEPVSIGQKWKTEHIQSNMGFVGKWVNEWQMTEIDENYAKIIGASDFTILETGDAEQTGGFMSLAQYGMEIEMEGDQQMEHTIDRKTGLINNGVVKANMYGYFKISEGEQSMSIPISFEITSKINLIE